jgi:hypothetical protein
MKIFITHFQSDVLIWIDGFPYSLFGLVIPAIISILITAEVSRKQAFDGWKSVFYSWILNLPYLAWQNHTGWHSGTGSHLVPFFLFFLLQRTHSFNFATAYSACWVSLFPMDLISSALIGRAYSTYKPALASIGAAGPLDGLFVMPLLAGVIVAGIPIVRDRAKLLNAGREVQRGGQAEPYSPRAALKKIHRNAAVKLL